MLRSHPPELRRVRVPRRAASLRAGVGARAGRAAPATRDESGVELSARARAPGAPARRGAPAARGPWVLRDALEVARAPAARTGARGAHPAARRRRPGRGVRDAGRRGSVGHCDPQSRARRQYPRARRQRRAPRVGGHLRTVLSSFPAKGGQRMNVTKSTKARTWRQALVLLALLSLPLVPPAFASDFAEIVFFGDSLSDPGNHFIAFGTTAHQPFVPIPDDSYAIGGHHFSNGATWAEQLAQALHVPTSGNPALRVPGVFTNYAVGRARARAGSVFPAFDLSTQVSQFLSDFG